MIESSYWGHIKTEGVVPSLFYGGDVRMQQDGQKSGLWEIRLLSGCSFSESPRLRWSVGKGFILFCCYWWLTGTHFDREWKCRSLIYILSSSAPVRVGCSRCSILKAIEGVGSAHPCLRSGLADQCSSFSEDFVCTGLRTGKHHCNTDFVDWCCTEIGWSPTVSLFEIFEHLTTSCYNLHRSKAFPGAPTGRGVALELAGKITRSFTCSQLVSKCTKNALLQKLFLRLRCNDRVNTAVFMIWRPRQIQMLSYKHIYI